MIVSSGDEADLPVRRGGVVDVGQRGHSAAFDPNQYLAGALGVVVQDDERSHFLSPTHWALSRRYLMQRRVKVHDKTYWVTTHLYSDPARPRAVWYATAEYCGEDIFVGGPTEDDALTKWIKAAEAKGPE